MLFHIENITRIITTFAAYSYCAIEDDDALAFLFFLVYVIFGIFLGHMTLHFFNFIYKQGGL